MDDEESSNMGQEQELNGSVLLPPPPPPPFDEPEPEEAAAALELDTQVPLQLQRVDPLPSAPAKEFKKVTVEGEPPAEMFTYKGVKAPLDAHLPQARLRVFCFDRTTGLALKGVTVHVNTLDNYKLGKKANYARAFGNASTSSGEGVVMLKLMSGNPYVLTATCDGYHKFGSMGEHLVVTMIDGEIMERSVGMVPLRITVLVTLRELRPLAGKTQKHDPYGQVNPLYKSPAVDPLALVTPQKVAFYSPEGNRMSFVAMPLMAHDALGVTEPQTATRIGDYSTDSDGHCFFYGARLDTWQREQRTNSYIDNGPWEYAQKYHLRANKESSPVKPRFEHFTEEVIYPAHIAAHPPPKKALDNVSPPRMGQSGQRWQPPGKNLVGQPRTPSPGPAARRARSARPASPSADNRAPAKSDGITSLLTQQFLHTHRDIAGMIQTPPGHESSEPHFAPPTSRGGNTSPRRLGSEIERMIQPLPGYGEGSEMGDYVPVDIVRQPRSLEQVDPEGIHNYLLPGMYNLSLVDPSRLLIFYTYSPDNEQAEVNKAQDAVVPFRMPEMDGSFYKPALNGRGKNTANMRFPVQLYCRARPWFQVVVYDSLTLQEVGSEHRFPFTIHRIDASRSFRSRVARVKEAMMGRPAGLLGNPHEVPEGQADPEVATYLVQQQKRGRLAGLWATAEVSEQARGASVKGRGGDGSTGPPGGVTDGLADEDPDIDDMRDEEVYVPLYQGQLDADMERQMWITPGERYAVEVHCQDPCHELTQRQVRQCSWQLEPFVFYTTRKVTLLIGCRERYNQAPIAGMAITATVLEQPPMQRPPVVKQEWCEGPEAYGRRVLDQLVDFIVQSRRPEATERTQTVMTCVTGDDGIASLQVVPGSRIRLQAEYGDAFEITDSMAEVTVSREGRQFQGFQLERVCYVRVACVDCETGSGVEGFVIKAYDVTHLATGLPGPELGLSPREQLRQQRDQEDLLVAQAASVYGEPVVSLVGIPAFHASTTASDGYIAEPITRRAGRVIKIVVAKSPKGHHLPHHLLEGSNAVLVYTYHGTHTVRFMVPSRPRVTVRVEDACTMEPVMGVRFRVWVRRLEPPHVPEGEEQAAEAARAAAAAERRRQRLLLESGALDEPTLDAGSIDDCRPKSDDGGDAAAAGEGDEDPGPVARMIDQNQVYWDGQPVNKAAAGGDGEEETLNARVLELVSGMEAPPPGARGPMRRRLEDVGTWAEGDSADAAGARMNATATQGWQSARERASVAAGLLDKTMRLGGATGGATGLTSGSKRGRGLDYEPSEAPSDMSSVWRRRRAMAAGTAGTATADASAYYGPEVSAEAVAALDARDDAEKAVLAAPEEEEGGWPEDPVVPEDTNTDLDIQEMIATPRDALGSGNDGDGTVGGAPQVWSPSQRPFTSALLTGGTGASQSGMQQHGGNTVQFRSRPGTGVTPATQPYLTPKVLPGAGVRSLDRSLSVYGDIDVDSETLWFDSYTGYPGEEEMIVHAGVEVRVQILPSWPYMPQHQDLIRRPDGWRSPAAFHFFLARDNGASAFWLDRDRSMPAFWTGSGAEGDQVRLPPHPLLRLQPAALPGALRPCPLGPWVRRLRRVPPTPPPAAEAAAVAVVAADGADAGAEGDGAAAPSAAASAVGEAYSTAAVAHGAGGSVEDDEAADGASGDGREASAFQFDEDADAADAVRAAAWSHTRLGDVQFLPVDRTRLMQLLVRWGAFPHIEGGLCKGCFAPQPTPMHPFLMAPATTVPVGGTAPAPGTRIAWATAAGAGASTATGNGPALNRMGSAPENATTVAAAVAAAAATAGPVGASTAGPPSTTGTARLPWRSQLFLDGYSLSAEWVKETLQWALQQKAAGATDKPHLACTPGVPDKHARTHAIIARSEATYCTVPFFTWRLPNGSAVHVGMHDNLYRDLIPLLDSVAASVEYMNGHLERAATFNASRVRQGRFLLGHMMVDACVGGVFVVDASVAMPAGGALFMLRQLATTLDYWYANYKTSEGSTPDSEPPHYNVLLVAGESIQVMHEALVPVRASNEADLVEWYHYAKRELGADIEAQGFKVSQALRTSLAMSDTLVPVVLICGAMLPELTEPEAAVRRALYEAQVGCLRRQRPMQPVFTVEMFPMPNIEERGNSAVSGQASTSGAAGASGGDSSGARWGAGGGADGAGVGAGGEPDGLADVSNQGADIFERLQEALAAGRMRLLEVFKETDKDADGALSPDELLRLVRRLVPGATRAHTRYLQLMLDADGDHFISYKELATVVKAAARSGMQMSLGTRLEVSMILQRVGFVMMLQQKTIDEVFNQYDHNHDGYWDHVEQWRALKDLFPSLTTDEQQQMFAALQAIDVNQDDRISRDEFTRAVSRGAAVALSGWGVAGSGLEGGEAAEQLGRKLTEEEEQDLGAAHAARAASESRMMTATRQAGFPLTGLLRGLAHTTRASHRRLDLGRARMYVQDVDLAPLHRLKAYLERSLESLITFEKAYGAQLTAERLAYAARYPLVAATRNQKLGLGLGSSSARDDPACKPRERPRRPKSAPLRRSNSAAQLGTGAGAPAASSRLLDSTAARNNYVADLARQRGAAPTSLLSALAARSERPAGGAQRAASTSGGSVLSAASSGSASGAGSTLPSLPGRRTYVPPDDAGRAARARPKSAPVRGRPSPSTTLPLPLLPPPPTARARPSLPMSSLQLEFNGPVYTGGWTHLSGGTPASGSSAAAAAATLPSDPFVSKRRGPGGFAPSILLSATTRSPLKEGPPPDPQDAWV